MRLHRMTPLPNLLFDHLMQNLSGSALRVYLKIARNTLGWRDEKGQFKSRDWIAHSQFEKVGLSNRSVTNGIQELLSHNLIKVTDENLKDLTNPNLRKRIKKVYYGLNMNHETLQNNNAKPTLYNTKDIHKNAKNVLNQAKNDQIHTQNSRTTKDIFTKKYNANERIPDHERLAEIMTEEEKRQLERNNWL
ncbi:MAG: replication protein [Flavobacteriales bacterium]